MADGAEDKIAACDDAVMPEDAKPAMRCLRVMEDIYAQDTGGRQLVRIVVRAWCERCGRNLSRCSHGEDENEKRSDTRTDTGTKEAFPEAGLMVNVTSTRYNAY